jgi:hypothetical protein
LLLLALVLLAFERGHTLVGKDVALATDNARRIQSLERALHLDIVLAVNRWLVQHEALVTPAVLFYRLYYVVLLGVLLWVLFRHSDVYPHIRSTLVAMAALALLVYWAYPLSPPRFALAGVVDVVAAHDPFGPRASHSSNYTAMPSLHVGWSALAAYALWYAERARHPRAALLAWVFPAVMVAVVFTTGNHYVLDVVGSALLLIASIATAHLWSRLRRPSSA